MLESPEARAKLRRKLEIWPDYRKSPVTINQGLELLDIIDKLEHTLKGSEGLLEVATTQYSELKDENELNKTIRESQGIMINRMQKQNEWLAEQLMILSRIGTGENLKKYWLIKAKEAVEQQNERR